MTGHVAALLRVDAVLKAEGANDGCGGRSLFWATVGVRRAAMADRDGTD
jgi:hypothetical protein